MRALTIAGIVGLPGIVVAALIAISEVNTFRTGSPLLLAPMPASFAEAAFTGDLPEVALRLGYGEDPMRRTPVRLPNAPPVALTVPEAAVLRGRPDVLRLVLARGPVVDAPTLHDLRCLSEQVNVAYRDTRMRAYLADLDTIGTPCQPLPPDLLPLTARRD